MAGIFLGAAPVNMGGPVKEVYVGATKVWPTGGPFPEIGFWASQHRHSTTTGNGQLLWASNPDIKTAADTSTSQTVTLGKTQSFNGAAPRLMGSAYESDINSLRMTVAQGGALVTGAVDTFQTRGYGSTSNTVSPLSISSLILVPPEQGDDLYYAVVNVGLDGSIAWSSEPGFSASLLQTGVFTLNLPFEITRLVGVATARSESAGVSISANLSRGLVMPTSSIQVRTFTGTSASTQAFSALILRV